MDVSFEDVQRLINVGGCKQAQSILQDPHLWADDLPTKCPFCLLALKYNRETRIDYTCQSIRSRASEMLHSGWSPNAVRSAIRAEEIKKIISFTVDSCDNPECMWSSLVRYIHPDKAQVGNGMFNVSRVYCECGWILRVKPTLV